jgi:hypothetical protein
VVSVYDVGHTGFGNQLARPLFRAKHRPDMSEEEAVDLIKEALEVRSCDKSHTLLHEPLKPKLIPVKWCLLFLNYFGSLAFESNEVHHFLCPV